MANRWEKVEIVEDFLFLGSKIIVVDDCRHEIKRLLLLGRTDAEAEAPILWPPDAKN